MLGFIGLSSLDELFDAVPEALRLAGGARPGAGAVASPTSLAEMERLAGAQPAVRPRPGLLRRRRRLRPRSRRPSRRLAFRSEFVTAYTPYQPEVAQGVLQALFEYQTLLSRLTGVEIANASLYDGATALRRGGQPGRRPPPAARRCGCQPGRAPALARGDAHASPPAPATSSSTSPLRRRASPPGPTTRASRAPCWCQYPNYLGCLEDLAGAARAGRRAPARCCSSPPTRWPPACCSTPGSLGRRRGGGGGAALRHAAVASAGPTSGCSPASRSTCAGCPGRLVGETVDVEGRRAYVTTLRTREQDIRREKASSNVCTNQTLIAVCCAIQLAWLGTDRPARAGPALRPGHPLHPGGAARHRRRRAAGRRARRSASSPCARRCRPRRRRRAHGRRGLPRRRRPRRRVRRRRPAGRRHRDAAPGPRSTPTSPPSRRWSDDVPSARRAGRTSRARSWAATRSPPSSSCRSPGRTACVVPHHRPARVDGRGAGARRAPAPPSPLPLAEVSERDLVAHFTRLTPPPVLGRPRRLPAGLVHHEVQPQALRRRRVPARPRRRAPGRARRR